MMPRESTRGGMMRRAFLLLALIGLLSLAATGVASAQEPATCLGIPATVTGSGTILGTDGPDVIVGSIGNDTILGLGGDDVVCGDLGNDSIDGGEGNDLLIGDSSQSEEHTSELQSHHDLVCRLL